MICPNCGYRLSPLDKECLKCKINPGGAQVYLRTPALIDKAYVEPPAQTQAPICFSDAALTKCPTCSHDISRAARSCPHCGEVFEPKTETRVFHIVLILWATFNTFGGVAGIVQGVIHYLGDPTMHSAQGHLFSVCAIALFIALPVFWWTVANMYGNKIRNKYFEK